MTGTGGTGALVSPAADATARSRWRSLVLTDPVARLVRNAVHAGIDDSAYDLRQLALAAIDLVVGSMGFARETTVDEVVDALTGLAARMRPAQQWEQEWQDVAQAVLKGLLNEAHEQRRFTYYFAEIGAGAGQTRWEPYSFRLLSLRDTEFGAVLVASDQAITLYLHGLDVDLEDADRALAHVLQRQLQDQRFDAAARTAAQAERTSVGLSATLTELLDATRRDVGSTDWVSDLPDRLTRARKHVEVRIAEDDRLLEHVQGGLDTEASPAVRAVSGQIVDLVGRAKQVHLDLERRLVGARDVFLTAHVRQRIARRRRLRMFTVGEDVLAPVLALPAADAAPVVEGFANRALGVTVPRLVRFDDLLDALWAVPRTPEPAPADAEDVDEPEPGDDPQGYPAAVMDAAQDVLAQVDEGSVRLSALLDDVAGGPGPDGADVAELVMLTALWAFAPDPADPTSADEEAGAEVGLLAGGLEAHDDGTPLHHALAGGRDLILSRRGSAPGAADETGAGEEVTG
jgi:hypothetical protein